MTVITSYAFGTMTIGATTHTRDMIILPSGCVLPDWYRQSGHLLTRADLKAALAEPVRMIIAGTGAHGRMAIDTGLEANLKKTGIRLVALKTAAAAERYNLEAENQTPGLCGCFHLAC